MTEPDGFETHLEERIERRRKDANGLRWSVWIARGLGVLFVIVMLTVIPEDIANGTYRWLDKLLISMLEFWVASLLNEKYRRAMDELKTQVAVLLLYRERR